MNTDEHRCVPKLELGNEANAVTPMNTDELESAMAAVSTLRMARLNQAMHLQCAAVVRQEFNTEIRFVLCADGGFRVERADGRRLGFRLKLFVDAWRDGWLEGLGQVSLVLGVAETEKGD